MDENGGWQAGVARGCLLPILVGMILGAGMMGAWLLMQGKLDLNLSQTPSPDTEGMAAAERVVILLLDDSGERLIGLWQWDPQAEQPACIASNDFMVNPPGRTVKEIVGLARGYGDLNWLASNASSIKTDCTPEDGTESAIVLVLTADELVPLVDSLGGLVIEGGPYTGDEAWRFLAEEASSADEQQNRERQIWAALSARAAEPGDYCAIFNRSDLQIKAVPGSIDGCQLLIDVLRQNPDEIACP